MCRFKILKATSRNENLKKVISVVTMQPKNVKALISTHSAGRVWFRSMKNAYLEYFFS